jgi:hypothetical protein
MEDIGRVDAAGGIGDARRTQIEELAKIKSNHVLLPAEPRGGRPARTVQMRCVTEPDAAQEDLLQRVGIDLPRRLRRREDPVPKE